MRPMIVLMLVTALAACSSSTPEVESGPEPQTRTIPGTEDPGAEPEMKNDQVPENASTAAKFGIPPGHLPPPGQCRVWMPGEPPGKQKKKYPSGDCSSVSREVPAGAWLVYRPGDDKKEVIVREYNGNGKVVGVSVFDAVTGQLLRKLDPDEES